MIKMFKKVDIYAKSLRDTITIINDSISTATVKVATDNTGARELTFIRIYTYKQKLTPKKAKLTHTIQK